jgi:hypothetical protein
MQFRMLENTIFSSRDILSVTVEPLGTGWTLAVKLRSTIQQHPEGVAYGRYFNEEQAREALHTMFGEVPVRVHNPVPVSQYDVRDTEPSPRLVRSLLSTNSWNDAVNTGQLASSGVDIARDYVEAVGAGAYSDASRGR